MVCVCLFVCLFVHMMKLWSFLCRYDECMCVYVCFREHDVGLESLCLCACVCVCVHV